MSMHVRELKQLFNRSVVHNVPESDYFQMNFSFLKSFVTVNK